ncbi:LysR substrate-binding domain-containing protein [Ralstonia mannitolilytica]|uniref:HTH-type transcriptional regulator HdfR n=1 Tax=Ralstonia mannitolilytica TaxID=105219 RepID=A0AAD2AI42_9RALS|nr:LysR substrate-binding domain-containing protein [Ralstonia mannitolilytica]AJW45781.1 LysR family transcriptional regulator [Ralstonia mannitolilytica]ANA32485.1 LysR family transcriptional regulator [Ralstonia mannitolilytica]MBY4718881.1 LysR family transcriptional regulator [Ralstonia mannitolilytica]CAJ0679909.1 HTH-type transcriptional regulator HdfR [Ralstonia mannitolilytica]CAJ0679937.1 HTH-type transcriptional regulator HdfR [Ralstonia mannitolilytica]
MPFDLRQLRAFTTIVSAGSLGRAAEILHVTQPALSRIIKRLEDEVGAPLFDRHAKGMQMTAIGEALLPHAALLQREADYAREEIDAMRGLAKGTIRVGAVGSIASHVLPLAVGTVVARWPNLRVEILEGVWDRLAEGLVKHEIDLALSMAMPDTEEIVAIPDCRWEDASFVVASPEHALHKRPALTLADTLEAPWAIPPRGTAPFEHVRQVFEAAGLGLPNIVVETRSVTALKSLVARSGFLSWMAEPMIDAERRAGVIEPLPIPGLVSRRTLTAFRRRHGILPSPAVKLLEALRTLTA